jgi:hypothetical protein
VEREIKRREGAEEAKVGNDRLGIEAQTKRRLANEYDAAQERSEVRRHGNKGDIPQQNITPATAKKIGNLQPR